MGSAFLLNQLITHLQEQHMKPSSCLCLCLLLLASFLLVLASAVTVSPSETSRATTWRMKRPATLPDDDFLTRLCNQQRGHPATMRRLPWCQQLHARRRRGGGQYHHVTVPRPGRVGEEIDARYGVSKRVVPTGPNPLHH